MPRNMPIQDAWQVHLLHEGGTTPLTGEKSGGLEKAGVHWHAVAYANNHKADGRVKTMLPE